MVSPADWVALLCDHGVTNVVFSFCRRCDGMSRFRLLDDSHDLISFSLANTFFCGFGLVYDVLDGYSVEA